MTNSFRWFSCDLKTGKRIAELPLTPTGTVSSIMCQDGAASFELPITDPACPDDWWLSIQPYRTCIVGDVGGVIVWAGWIKSIDTSSENNSTIDFVCSTMEGYLQERFVDGTLTFSSPDQHKVIRDLVGHANSNGIGILLDAPDSGTFLDGTVRYDRFSDQQIYEMITTLSDAEGGPEWAITSAWSFTDPDVRVVHTLRARTPYLGSVDPIAHHFDYPGPVRSWQLTQGGPYYNNVVAGGEGDGTGRVMSTPGIATDTNAISKYGFAQFDGRISTQLTNVTAVNRIARGELAAKRFLTVVLSLTLDADAIDVTNLWAKGDTCTITIDAPNLKGQYSDVWRIIGWDVDSIENTITPHLIEFR